MPFENKKLLLFLKEVDKELDKKITIIAVGGTAMTLLKIKKSTIDIDFNFTNNQDLNQAKKIMDNSGFKIDYFVNGYIFSQQLPKNYLQKTIPIKTKLKNISLRALHPIDIIASKIGRLNERDIQDIENCIKKFKLTKKQVNQRANQTQYTGHEPTYKSNKKFVLKKFFKEKD